MLPSDQSRTIEKAKVIYSPLDKEFEKLIKAIQNQGIKQVEGLKALKSNKSKQDIKSIDVIFAIEIKNEIDEIKK